MVNLYSSCFIIRSKTKHYLLAEIGDTIDKLKFISKNQSSDFRLLLNFETIGPIFCPYAFRDLFLCPNSSWISTNDRFEQ